MKSKSLIIGFILLQSCGQISELKSLPVSTANNNTISPQLTYAGPYTPGSYFKILNDAGTAKDTRIFEFHYFSGGTFIIWQKSFPGGNLANGYFHKTSGTYKEDGQGNISHQIQYDSCNDLNANTINFTGDPKDIVNIYVKGTSITSYSASTWKIPSNISSQIVTIVEDQGCTKF